MTPRNPKTRTKYMGLLTKIVNGERLTSELIKEHGCQSCTGLILRDMGLVDKYSKWVKGNELNEAVVDEMLNNISTRRSSMAKLKSLIDLTPCEDELIDYIEKIKTQYRLSTETKIVLDSILNKIKS
jgi:hypothetical protein